MKRRLLYALLIIEAALCVAFNLTKASLGKVFSVAAAFPFEQIGLGLRKLSLSGKLGNALSLTIYAAVCLLPVIFLVRVQAGRKLHIEDSLPALFSGFLFVTLYFMINPSYIGSFFGGVAGTSLIVGKAVLGGTLWSIVFGYIILRVLRLSFESGTEKLYAFVGALLSIISFLFIWAVFFGCFGKLLESFSALQKANTGNENGLAPTYLFIVLRFLLDALPYLLDAVTVFLALDLLYEMRLDRYSEKTEEISSHLSTWCGTALAAVVVSGVMFNLLQIIFARLLRNINSNISIPLSSVLFVLAVLLTSRLISENRRLKGDNDLFI